MKRIPGCACATLLSQGVATEDQHTVLHTAFHVALAIEDSGIVRGLHEHIASALQAMATRTVAKNRLGAANATFFTGFDLGIGVGAMFFGKIASIVGYSHMYLISMFCALIGLIVYIVFVRKHYTGAEKDPDESSSCA